MDYFLNFSIIPISIYFIFILFCIYGLFKTKIKIKNFNYTFSPNTSVVICVRNGEKSLPYILNDLKNQVYEGDIEFIIVDDDSVDNSKIIIKEFCKADNRFKYTSSNKGNISLKYKKRALDAGISESKYDYLLFTDVDCRVNKYWVASMMDNYKNPNINFIIGPSIVENSCTNFVSKFQHIDFFILIMSSLSTAQLNFPLASTGQNQSYKRKLFNKIDGFSKIENLLQGDDSIFLQLCKKNKIVDPMFSADLNSFTSSKEIISIKEFILQRIRWAADGKIMWKYNKFFYIILLSTLFCNTLLLYPIFFKIKYFWVFLIIIQIKFILEFIFYFIGKIKLQQKIEFQYFLYWFLFNIPYVCITGLMSFFVTMFKWKSRKIL